MKKIIFILATFAINLSSCSKDDVKKPAATVNYHYSISIISDCPKTSSSVKATYDVTKTTYDRIKQDYDLGSSCFWASFKDLNNKDEKGYVTSIEYYSSN